MTVDTTGQGGGRGPVGGAENMIRRVESLSPEQLERVKRSVGEAFVSNELFHNWGTAAERREDVLKYMSIYVDYVWRAGELYANEELTALIGLEDSGRAPVLPRIHMILRLITGLPFRRVRSFLHFARQVGGSNARYAKRRHLDALLVCVDKDRQSKGLASELVRFAQGEAGRLGVPLLFDTDVRAYAEMYQHLGCTLYNTVTADNGVTRFSLCYEGTES